MYKPLLFLMAVLLFSCQKETKKVIKKTSGKINTVAVVIDDQLWNGEVGDLLRSKLAAPVVGLPQEEPLFNINQYPTKLMEGFMTDNRNIIVVKRDTENCFEIIKNQYASPQNVFHISGRSNTGILELIEKNSLKILQTIKNSEIAESQRLQKRGLLNVKVLKDSFKIAIAVPANYKYALQKKRFMWLKKEISNGNSSVLIYDISMRVLKNKSNLVMRILKIRDSVGDLFIRGKGLDSPMITEKGYSPYFFKTKINGFVAFETKGTWELKNDFMSGPFINYFILDTKNNRVLVLEGFCYAPASQKRDLMHELEAILKSTVILN